ncbi:MAG: hydroxyacid dehydrogenase [Actinobacteria bacterium]|nr:hydroxyacid dehydrogenase [Actinomycetota bacterium]
MKIFITADFSESGMKRLTDAGHDVSYCCWGATHEICTEEQLIENLKGFDVLIVGYEPVTEKVLKSTDLKIICSIRGGPRANIDVDLATSMKIPIIYTLGREAIPVADFTMGQIICLVRQIVKTDKELRSGKFTAPAASYGSDKDVIWDMSLEGPWESRKGIELTGKILGLIGFGTVGQEVAKRAAAFGMKVIAYDPYQKDAAFINLRVEKVSLEDLCKRSDVISIHARGTDQNKGMIGQQEFALMKNGVYVINNARAVIIDETSFREAVYSGKVAGAALDVFHQEPVKADDPFLKMDNIVVTPHIAGAGLEVVYRHSDMICDDLFSLLKGEMPKAIINPETVDDFSRFKNLAMATPAGRGQIIACSMVEQMGSGQAEDSELINKISEEVIRQIKLKISESR